MTIKEIAEKILRENRKELHIKEIASLALGKDFIQDIDSANLSHKIGAVITNDIKKQKRNSIFRKVKNKRGGFKKGFYKIKKVNKTQAEKIINTIEKNKEFSKPTVSTNYIGKAGEFAALSELLFNGFNANIMSVDEGIDVVASRDNKFFYIQVKTTYVKNNKLNVPSIKFDRYNQFDKYDTFYIFVLRYYQGEASRNEYLIFRSNDLERLMSTKLIKKEKDKLRLNLKFENNKILITNSNKKEEVSYHFNNFNIIK
jgi:hypothetical protein